MKVTDDPTVDLLKVNVMNLKTAVKITAAGVEKLQKKGYLRMDDYAQC